MRDRPLRVPPDGGRANPLAPEPASAAAPAVAVRGLARAFDGRWAVGGVDLDVPRGSFFGLLGPNGAGKTTTLRMVTGLLRPDRGTAIIQGIDVWRDPNAAKRRMGVLPDDVRLFERLNGRELLTYNGLLRSIPADVVEARAAELLDVLGLADRAGTLVGDYSQGMRKKVALACALLHAPTVLFLDEPFESVDPVSARTIREVLDQFTGSGGTVIFSSHVLDTVERLCDRVAIMHLGRIVVEGAIADVRAGRSLEDVFVDAVGAQASTEGRLGWLSSSSG